MLTFMLILKYMENFSILLHLEASCEKFRSLMPFNNKFIFLSELLFEVALSNDSYPCYTWQAQTRRWQAASAIFTAEGKDSQ